jgi:hypothetical protein
MLLRPEQSTADVDHHRQAGTFAANVNVTAQQYIHLDKH